MKLFHYFHAHKLPLTAPFQLPILLCLKSQNFDFYCFIQVICESLNTWVQGRFKVRALRSRSQVRALKSVHVSFGWVLGSLGWVQWVRGSKSRVHRNSIPVDDTFWRRGRFVNHVLKFYLLGEFLSMKPHCFTCVNTTCVLCYFTILQDLCSPTMIWLRTCQTETLAKDLISDSPRY